jgi:hypothetical protein
VSLEETLWAPGERPGGKDLARPWAHSNSCDL